MGVILGYGARVDPGALGFPICADVRIKLTNPSEENSESFEAWARNSDFVDSCFVTTGTWDYVLRIRASTLEAYEAFLKKEVRGAGIALTLESSIVLRAIKS
jgi:Lrp/AsnC family leucine-responsive transcriptional regulator